MEPLPHCNHQRYPLLQAVLGCPIEHIFRKQVMESHCTYQYLCTHKRLYSTSYSHEKEREECSYCRVHALGRIHDVNHDGALQEQKKSYQVEEYGGRVPSFSWNERKT